MSSLELLNSYDISTNGFIPEEHPLENLPEYFEPWDRLVYKLPVLIKENNLKEAVKVLPLLDSTKLETSGELQRGYLILSMIAHSYMWDPNYNNKPEFIPSQLAIPWHNIATRLGIVPILTHAAVDLYNWKLIDKSGSIVLDNLRAIHTITGTFDEEWFYIVMTAIEKKGFTILLEIVNIYKINLNDDFIRIVIDSLQNIRDTLIEIKKILGRMKEKCRPEIFFNVLRPFLGGWFGNDTFPNGIVYQGVSEEPMKYVGGSAAQSSLLPSIDAAFNVEHADVYFEKIKKYMPDKHREFINFVKDNINIRTIVESSNNPQLTSIYNDCLSELKKLRLVHRGIAELYIQKMIQLNEGSTTKSPDELKGTGGTTIAEFLTKAIDETGSKIYLSE